MTNQPFRAARAIWARDYDVPNMFLVTEKTLILTGDERLRLCISVDADFALEINGSLAAFGQYPDYAAHKVFEMRDVSDAICPGENVLRLILTSQNADSSTDRREQAMVIFELTDERDNVLWASDENTVLYHTARYRDSGVPLITGQLGFSFDCDLTAPACGAPADTILLQNAPTAYEPRPVAALVLGERVTTHQVLCCPFADAQPAAPLGVRMQKARYLPDGAQGDGVALIYDLGRESVGFVDLELTLPHDADVLIGWGEHLDDGRVRTDVGGRCFAARCRMPAGTRRFLYPLRRLGLRYLQLHILAHGATVHYAGIRPVDYPLPAARPCPFDSALHRAIYDTCLQTLRHCMHDHYEDCPWREQALYAMDSRNQMLCGYAAWGESAMPRASLQLMARSLRADDHLLELCSPARVGITIPAFSAIFPVQAAEYLDATGDTEFACELLPVLLELAEGFYCRTAQNGLLGCYVAAQHWNFYEWQAGLEGKIGGVVADENVTYDAPLCCFVSLAYAAVADVLQALGRTDEAQCWQERHADLNRALHAAFYDAERATYFTYVRCRDGERYHRTQLTSALAVLCGACPADEQPRVLAALAKDESLLPVTLSHSIFRYQALLRDREHYATFVLEEIGQIWGDMLQKGATTFWETADGAPAFGGAGSLCHGWSAIPVYIYHMLAGK